MSETLDQVIKKADNYIKDLVSRMIEARLKIIDASSKTLELLKYLLKEKTYEYTLGSVYDPMIRVKPRTFQLQDIQRPTIQLSYVGGYKTLEENGTFYRVPAVKDFIFTGFTPSTTVLNPDEIAAYLSIDQAIQSMAIRIPKEYSTDPAPDYEDDYWKYFKLELVAEGLDEKDWSAPAGFQFPWYHGVIKVTKFHSYHYADLQRIITIDGTTAQIGVRVRTGKYYTTYEISPGSYWSDVLGEGLYVLLLTDSDKVDALVFRQDFLPRAGTPADGWYFSKLWIVIYRDIKVAYATVGAEQPAT